MKQRQLGPYTVSAIGLGCMNLSHAYGAPPAPEVGEALIHRALDLGVTMFDTAALYGFGTNELLVGRALKSHRSQITLCSKGGMAGVSFPDGVKRVIDGRPETLRKNCEESLSRLGTDVIDLYYLRAGKIREIGLSEVSATTLRKAHAVHPIAAVQTEYSLWTRNPEIAVLKACEELGATFVAFSPVARGFLCGDLRDVGTLAANDIRRAMPRFSADTYATNLPLLDAYQSIAREVGCTPAQLALAWLLHKDSKLIPIPGTQNIRHLEDDIAAADVVLSAEHMQRLEALINQQTVKGPRYNALNASEVDTEEFAS